MYAKLISQHHAIKKNAINGLSFTLNSICYTPTV